MLRLHIFSQKYCQIPHIQQLQVIPCSLHILNRHNQLYHQRNRIYPSNRPIHNSRLINSSPSISNRCILSSPNTPGSLSISNNRLINNRSILSSPNTPDSPSISSLNISSSSLSISNPSLPYFRVSNKHIPRLLTLRHPLPRQQRYHSNRPTGNRISHRNRRYFQICRPRPMTCQHI